MPEVFMCMKCFEIYKPLYIKKNKITYCPKVKCFGDVVEIDELFVLPIRILNQKGYKTKYCCSGHMIDEYINSYISFDDNVINLPSLPKGFYLDDNDYLSKQNINKTNITIRRDFNSYFSGDYLNNVQVWSKLDKSESEIYKDLLQGSVDILDWANSLPELK